MNKRVGAFLIDYLHINGVDKIFGVPGDFNLAFLDDVISHDSVQWVGNTNELNASYAADGYARMNGIGALITTFGVGELSAVNGIAGSYAERVPVIQITGAPTTAAEKEGRYVHHSLGEGQYDNYRKMYEQITTATAYITTDNALTEIPRIINTAIRERRPVHIHLPIDVALSEITIDEMPQPYQHESQSVSQYTEAVKERLTKAQRPVIIAGHEINSFHLHEQLDQFINQTKIPATQLSLGKSAVNEQNDYYLGVYDGRIANKTVRDYVDQSDCIINLGAKLTDSATAGFSYQFDVDDMITINHNNFKSGDVTSDNIHLIDIMNDLLTLDYQNEHDIPQVTPEDEEDATVNDEPLTQKQYFTQLQRFFKEGDVIIADQGTSFFGSYSLPLPKNTSYIGQPLWGSIGYTLPSLLGSQLATPDRRNILLIGDGSVQLTVQELSTMIRERIKPVIFVINNDGYTVERLIHGMKEPYNDIQPWHYAQLPQVFGDNGHVETYEVKTSQELADALKAVNNNTESMHLLEVHMDAEDSPQKLVDIAQELANANS